MGTENIGGIDVVIQARDQAYQAAMRRAAQTARQTGQQINQAMANAGRGGLNADRIFTNLGNRLVYLGRNLRNITSTMAAASGVGAFFTGRAFLETVGGFEQKMEIIKQLSGATANQMRALEEQTISLGASTARTAGQVADGALELQKMGRSMAEIQQILPAVTNFAIASDQEVGSAARTASATLMQFRLAASDTARVMDVLMRGANQSAADVGEFSIALTYAGQQAFNANVSLERTIALMEAASNAGIPGSRLGTGLQSVLNDIYMPNYRQIDLFRRYGIITRETTGELRDLYAILQDIFTKLPQNQWGRLEVDTQNFLMAIRGQGIDAVRGMEADLFSNAGGENSRTAEARMRGLKGALDALGGAFDALLIKIGDSGLTAALTKLFRDIGGWVQSLGELGSTTLSAVAAFGAFALALNPVMFILGSILAILTSPEGLIASLVVMAVAASAVSTLQAQIAGIGDANREAADATRLLAENMGKLAAGAGAAADAIRQQNVELRENLRAQADAADAEAARLEARAAIMRGSGRPGGLTGAAIDEVRGWFGESARDAADRARARATRLSELHQDAVRRTSGRGFDGAVRTASTASAPPLLQDPAAAEAMSPLTGIRRQTEQLEALAAAARQSAYAMERLAGIQAIVDQSRDSFGGAMDDSAAAAQFERRQRAQDAIALAQVRDQTRRTAEEQDTLTRAAAQGEEAYERARIALDLMRESQGLTVDEAARMAAAIHASNKQLKRATTQMQRWADTFRSIGDSVAGAFEQAIIEGGKLSDTLRSLARDVLQLVLRSAVTQPLADSISRGLRNLFNGGGGGFSLNDAEAVLGGSGSSGIVQGDGGNGLGRVMGAIARGIGQVILGGFGGGFAAGGQLGAGKWGIVGENGPELLAGGMHGATIVPLTGRAGGGGMVIDARAFIDAKGADAAAIRRLEAALARRDAELTGRIRATVGDMSQRGRLAS